MSIVCSLPPSAMMEDWLGGSTCLISRNPMYLGMLMMLIGSSFLVGTIPSLFAPVAFFLIIDKVFIPYEEEKLVETFGAEYSYYAQKVRRWI